MKFVQAVKEIRLLVSEVRKLAILITQRKNDKSKKPSR